MERIYMNQTALSLGYIALKRIRALEATTSRLPSNPLLRHLGHIKILAACVEQVGPEEIIEYELNQDFASEPESSSGSQKASLYDATHPPLDRRIPARKNADDEVAPQRYHDTRFTTIPNSHLPVIAETIADAESIHIEYCATPGKQATATTGAYVTAEEMDTDEDYSMDELYDEYNSQEDDWETASDLSEDDETFMERLLFDDEDGIPHLPATSRRISKSSDMESDDDDDLPSTPPPTSVVISRSPPLDITTKHPITHELSKREQMRRTADTAGTGKPGAFVEQIEDVLCHEIRCLSLRGMPGKARLDSVTRQQVSLFA